MNLGSLSLPIKKIYADWSMEKNDIVAVEEPLEIRLGFADGEGHNVNQTIAVTMRTPGQDIDLALGFLYTEGVIQNREDVVEVAPCGGIRNQALSQNIIRVKLRKNINVDLKQLNRHSFTNSSCGICGKTSIEALRTKLPRELVDISNSTDPFCRPKLITKLPGLLKNGQSIFNQTGGLHASALFATTGELRDIREDVGRHNALDKLIGSAFLKDLLPLSEAILLLSGRVSFELVQKASMAGIPIIAAVGAPSSLAVELAKERAMTLLGFVGDKRFNIYCGAARVRNETEAERQLSEN